MKKLVIVAAALALSAGSAVAQDDAVFDWSGAYIGATIGHEWGDGKYVSPLDGQSASPHPNGFLGSIYGGYNHRLANDFIVGVEGDFNFDGGDDLAVFSPAPIADTMFDLKWSGSTRARLGYSFGPALPFVTAGAAFGKIDHDVASHSTPRSVVDEFSSTLFGWTVGAGVDYALSRKVIGRVEYRYTDYGTKDFSVAPGGAYPHSISLKTQDIRLGIAYKF